MAVVFPWLQTEILSGNVGGLRAMHSCLLVVPLSFSNDILALTFTKHGIILAENISGWMG
jgi:hypothetical protein